MLALEFPPSQEVRLKIRDFFEKEIAKRLLAPSIVLTEFIEIAGARMDEDAAKNRIRLLKDKGMRTVALGEEEALVAGGLLLSHRNVPIADALIASLIKTGVAEYIITDDPHFKALGVKTKWL